MKRWIHAASELKKVTYNVDQFLKDIFGFGYTKQKSPWILTDYGTIKYEVFNASMSLSYQPSYTVRIFFNKSDFDPQLFKDAVSDMIMNGYNVTMHSEKGSSSDEPQINVRIPKYYKYTDSDVEDIKGIIEDLLNKCSINPHKIVQSDFISKPTAQGFYLLVEYFDDGNIYYTSEAIEVCTGHQDEIHDFESNICTMIENNYPVVKRCKLESFKGGTDISYGCGLNIICK